MITRDTLRSIGNNKSHLEHEFRIKNLVSVCIPNYNKGLYIEECLKSIYDQSYPNIELVVVDDYSSDNSREIIESFLKKHKKRFVSAIAVYLPRRVGNAWATNLSYYLSKGEFLAQMDSDDISLPQRISKQITFLNDYGYDLVGSNFKTAQISLSHIVNEDGGYWLKFRDDEINKACKNEVHCVCFGTILFKYDVLTKTGGLNKELIGTEDWDFIDRVYKAGFKIGNLRDLLYIYRLNPGQRSSLFHKN